MLVWCRVGKAEGRMSVCVCEWECAGSEVDAEIPKLGGSVPPPNGIEVLKYGVLACGGISDWTRRCVCEEFPERVEDVGREGSEARRLDVSASWSDGMSENRLVGSDSSPWEKSLRNRVGLEDMEKMRGGVGNENKTDGVCGC